MSRASKPHRPPDHSETSPRRHRRWLGLSAAVALGAVAGLALPHWRSATVISPPAEISVALPALAVAPSAQEHVLSPEADNQATATPTSATPSQMPSGAIETSHPSAEQPAWLRFAGVVPVEMRERPKVAIVIDDLGLDRPRTERVIALPAAVTLSFLPYSDDLPPLIAAAQRNGHEMIVHVPMEPQNGKLDMGRDGLATNLSRDEVLRRLDWDLARFSGYVGINNHMGSRFTGDAQGMGWVMDELKARGLMFLDSRTTALSVGAKVAASAGVPFAERDVFLDDDQSASAIEQRLKDVETIARKKGIAIAIGHPHDATIEALISWIANLPQKNIVLVPLTEIVKERMGTG